MSEAEPFVAPYGGLLTRTVDEQNEREAKLKEQAVTVNVNGNEEVVRPESLFIRGVDSLSTDDIKAFIDYYVNYEVTNSAAPGEEPQPQYEPHPIEEQITFRVQWVNDSSVNVVFKTNEDAIVALRQVSITSSNPNIPKTEDELREEFSVANNIQERETKPYSPIIQFKKQIDLKSRIGIQEPKDEDAAAQQNETEKIGMEEDESFVVLYTRQSFKSDVKVKGASTYSRYYLLHGEPERRPRNHNRRGGRQQNNRGGRRSDGRSQRQQAPQEEEDLFASKLSSRGGDDRRSNRDNYRDDRQEMDIDDDRRQRDRSRSPVRQEEDLFASRLRR